MSEMMIERVARAMCHAADVDPDEQTNSFRPEGRMPQWYWRIEEARAAITAMREPTEAMVDAAGRAFYDATVAYEPGDKTNTPFVRFHRAAIDAILSEPERGEPE